MHVNKNKQVSHNPWYGFKRLNNNNNKNNNNKKGEPKNQGNMFGLMGSLPLSSERWKAESCLTGTKFVDFSWNGALLPIALPSFWYYKKLLQQNLPKAPLHPSGVHLWGSTEEDCLIMHYLLWKSVQKWEGTYSSGTTVQETRQSSSFVPSLALAKQADVFIFQPLDEAKLFSTGKG